MNKVSILIECVQLMEPKERLEFFSQYNNHFCPCCGNEQSAELQCECWANNVEQGESMNPHNPHNDTGLFSGVMPNNNIKEDPSSIIK